MLIQADLLVLIPVQDPGKSVEQFWTASSSRTGGQRFNLPPSGSRVGGVTRAPRPRCSRSSEERSSGTAFASDRKQRRSAPTAARRVPRWSRLSQGRPPRIEDMHHPHIHLPFPPTRITGDEAPAELDHDLIQFRHFGVRGRYRGISRADESPK